MPGDNVTTSFLVLRANDSLVTEARTSVNTVSLSIVLYLLPVIFTFGIFGNWLSFAVLLSHKLRRVSTNVYLAALSASNSVFLLAAMVVWTDTVGIKLVHRPVLCQVTVYLTYCSSFLSVWLVVCIAVDNFVIHLSLRTATRLCTARRALGVVVVLLLTSFLLYSVAIWTTAIVTVTASPAQHCAAFPRYQSLETFTMVDTSVAHIVPTVLIVALVAPPCLNNTCLNNTCLNNTCLNNTCLNNIRPTSRRALRSSSAGGVMLRRRKRELLGVTRLLCVIIVSFVVLTTPTRVNKLRNMVLQQSPSQKAGLDDMYVVHIYQVLYDLSSSMNFIYLLIWGKRFRSLCSQLVVSGYNLKCRCRKRLLYAGVATNPRR